MSKHKPKSHPRKVVTDSISPALPHAHPGLPIMSVLYFVGLVLMGLASLAGLVR